VVGQYEGDLLATVAKHFTLSVSHTRKPFRDFPKDRVARLMAMAVIDLLEVVNISHYNGKRLLSSGGLVERGGEMRIELCPVRELG
jgi:hypothetical protein